VPEVARDRWADWILERRAGGDEERLAEMRESIAPVRDRVLEGARIGPADVVLDVGAGDGLIAFGALERLGPEGRVVFADVSEDLLDVCRSSAGGDARCEFVLGSADDLPLEDGSVDVVTTRSVLIYLDRRGKRRGFEEFFRVLRPGGRLSIFEPINSFGHSAPPGWLCGYDLTEIPELVQKVVGAFSPEEENTLIDFDERDLVAWAEEAGFYPVELTCEVAVKRGSWLHGRWENVLRTSGNPLAPSLGEAIEQALTPEEAERFEAHLRPLVEANEARQHTAVAYLRGLKP
jgi:ubiquinone/menaquinone biosynthesis C-methylase UbiE